MNKYDTAFKELQGELEHIIPFLTPEQLSALEFRINVEFQQRAELLKERPSPPYFPKNL